MPKITSPHLTLSTIPSPNIKRCSRLSVVARLVVFKVPHPSCQNKMTISKKKDDTLILKLPVPSLTRSVVFSEFPSNIINSSGFEICSTLLKSNKLSCKILTKILSVETRDFNETNFKMIDRPI